jgi:quercetin dioxygenase-like cupin family protein
MITKNESATWHDLIPGIRVSTLVHGDKTLMARFELQERAFLPLHSHMHEQTGYLVSGRLRLTVGEETFEAGPGDAWTVAPEVSHGGEALVDSVAVEVFSPVREDYLTQ